MGATGGYQIIDFGGANFLPNTPVKIEGVYSKIVNTKKAILFSDMFFAGIRVHSCFVALSYYDYDYHALIPTVLDGSILMFDVKIAPDDYVTLTITN